MINAYSYRAGLIAAAISVFYTIVSYFAGIEMFTNLWVPSVISVGIIVYLIISLKKIRTMLGGYMSFNEGIVNFLVMSVVYVVISQFVYFLIVNVIDPEFGIAVNDVIIEKAIGMMESFGAPEDSIGEALADMEADFEAKATFVGILMTMLKIIAFFFVVGLVTSAVLKRKNEGNIETID